MSKTELITVTDFLAFSRKYGVRVMKIEKGVITLAKAFEANNQEEYAQAESDCYRVMGLVPLSRHGSTWGTTSDGVGGWAGCQAGLMRLNRSGCNLNWLKQLSKKI